MNNRISSSPRLEVVDALRGFALLAIVLLHNLEHYNIYYNPEGQPDWLNALDKGLWDGTFFLFAGKAFATFSMLFGFSFFIQMDNQARRGYDFRPRFAWRLVLLMFVFAQLHALFYNGDILFMYGLCGFLLLPVCKLSNRTVAAIAFFLLLQPFEWYRMAMAMLNPDYATVIGENFWTYGARCMEPTQSGTFLEALRSNITDGQLFSNFWQMEHGRLFQIPALFMFGMLLGRLRHFVKSEVSIRFWRKTLIATGVLFLIVYGTRLALASIIAERTTASFRTAYDVAISSYQNFCLMCVLVSAFTLLWFRKGNGFKAQRFIIPYGRMSLTNYITQSIIGTTIYYGYGLGLWKHTGATATLLIAFGIFGVQWAFSRWWLTSHKQGPLEFLWKKLTWIEMKSKALGQKRLDV